MPSALRRLRFLLLLFPLVIASGVAPVDAKPSYFASRCASCHTNDTQTCNGCHHHVDTIAAIANHTTYPPGAAVTVTLDGGTEHGWIRAVLYDQANNVVARRSGPTSAGDDGLANAVVFPATLTAVAPMQPGDYTWQAAWFGNSGDGGSAHGEVRTPVVIHVVASASDVEVEPPVRRTTWDRIKSLYR